MITVVLPQKLEPRAKLSPGGSQHARCHRRHSLTDLLFQVVHVMDRSLIDSVLDVTPQKSPEVWCLETWQAKLWGHLVQSKHQGKLHLGNP